MKMILFLQILLISLFASAQFTLPGLSLPPSSYLQGYSGKMIPSLAVSIASGQSASGIINQGGLVLAGCLFPSAMTGTTITFTMSADGTNFFPVYNSAGAVSYTIAASRYLSIATADLQGIQYLKIVSGSTEAATRSLICSLKGI